MTTAPKAGDDSAFDEPNFAEVEYRRDAQLYRDPRLREGIAATLEQRIPDFRSPAP